MASLKRWRNNYFYSINPALKLAFLVRTSKQVNNMTTVLNENGVMVTTLPDGLVVESFPDGTTIAKREDGS
jgi:hypothetical protein